MDRKVLEVSSLSLSFSDYLPTCLSIFYVSIYLSIYLSLSFSLSSNYLSTYLSMYLSFYLSIYLSISLSLFHRSICLAVYLSIYLSMSLPGCFTLQVSRICAMAVGTTATKLGSKARQTWVMSWLRGIRRISMLLLFSGSISCWPTIACTTAGRISWMAHVYGINC